MKPIFSRAFLLFILSSLYSSFVVVVVVVVFFVGDMSENPSEKDQNKLRFFDNDGYRPRAACICIRNENEDQVRR